MTIGTHQLECGRIGVVQIQQDVAGVPVVSIGLKVYVTAFTIANAQESYCRLLAQLGGRPEPFARECGSGGVVNQPNQIEIMWHRGELSSNAAQGEEQTTIKHKCCRRSDSPYNALMVRPPGRKAKQLAANRECQNPRLSQKRAQPRKWQNVPRKVARSYRLVVLRLYHPFRIVLGQLSGRFRLGGLTRQLGSLPSGRPSAMYSAPGTPISGVLVLEVENISFSPSCTE